MVAQVLKTLMQSRKCRLKIDLVSSKEVFTMYGCSLISNDLKWWVIYRFAEKLVVSSNSEQNLQDSVDRSIFSVDSTELVVTVQSDRSNDSKFDHWHIRLTVSSRPNLVDANLLRTGLNGYLLAILSDLVDRIWQKQDMVDQIWQMQIHGGLD